MWNWAWHTFSVYKSMEDALNGLHRQLWLKFIYFIFRTCFSNSKIPTKSAVNHPQLPQPYIHRHWLSHADVHMCTHTLYIAMNTCCSTYISFSKLGFKALHVQSGPCSYSLNLSVKAAKEKTQMFKVSDVCFHFEYDLGFLKGLNYRTYQVFCDAVYTRYSQYEV